MNGVGSFSGGFEVGRGRMNQYVFKTRRDCKTSYRVHQPPWLPSSCKQQRCDLALWESVAQSPPPPLSTDLSQSSRRDVLVPDL